MLLYRGYCALSTLDGYDLHDCDSEVLRDESTGVLSSPEDVWSIWGASWIRGSIRGVPSNSAHPPLNPISTTRSSIRPISSFLNIANVQSPVQKKRGSKIQLPLTLVFQPFLDISQRLV